MSLYRVTSSFLSLKPRIWREGGRIRLRTGLLLQALSLFSWRRRVTIDPGAQTVTVETRYLWGLQRRRAVPFSSVEYIDYGFGSLMTGWSLWSGTTDQVESFSVALVLKGSGERVTLAKFRGEGSRMTGWSGVLLGGDDLVDWSGDQEEASRSFVRTLQAILQVPLGKPVATARGFEGERYRCVSCGRDSPPNKTRCQYCGKPVRRI